MKQRAALLALGCAGLVIVVASVVSLASPPTPTTMAAIKIDPSRVDNVPSGRNADSLVKNLLNATYAAAGSIAIIVIIVAGIMYITSDGDSSKTATAKNAIIYAVVGLVIIGLAFILTGVVQNIANA